MVSKKVLTLVFVKEPGKILLGMKKRGFGQGRWNGFGGKVEKGETILEGAKSYQVRKLKLGAFVHHKITRMLLKNQVPGVNYDRVMPRELLEESGVTANSLSRVGLINFEFEKDPVILEVHIFKTSDYTGTPTETEEMSPKWYSEDSIPFSQMWPDDHLWFPFMFSNKLFESYFLFKGMDVIVSHWIKEVDNLDNVVVS